MSIERRLADLEDRNGHLKREPLVISWRDGEPYFRGKPETKQQAISFIRKRMKADSLTDLDIMVPKDLILIPQGENDRPLQAWLMKTFNISTAEL